MLTDIQIRKAKPAEKAFKLFDEKRLFLLIHPNGSKYWRLKYRFDDKEKLLAIGVYPDVTLSEARTKRDGARSLLANGIDPSQMKEEAKKTKKALFENTFGLIVREWLAKSAPQ